MWITFELSADNRQSLGQTTATANRLIVQCMLAPVSNCPEVYRKTSLSPFVDLGIRRRGILLPPRGATMFRELGDGDQL
jgi:hypothetical protein